MDDYGCNPNAVTCEIFIMALLEKNESNKAEKLLREVISRGLLK